MAKFFKEKETENIKVINANKQNNRDVRFLRLARRGGAQSKTYTLSIYSLYTPYTQPRAKRCTIFKKSSRKICIIKKKVVTLQKN